MVFWFTVVLNHLTWWMLKTSKVMLVEIKEVMLNESVKVFSQGEDGVVRYQGQLCDPNVEDLGGQIWTEAHSLGYSNHRGSTKMYLYLC